jgi:hypothetical protein
MANLRLSGFLTGGRGGEPDEIMSRMEKRLFIRISLRSSFLSNRRRCVVCCPIGYLVSLNKSFLQNNNRRCFLCGHIVQYSCKTSTYLIKAFAAQEYENAV